METVAHETGHTLGLDHMEQTGNNLMDRWRSSDINDITITQGQIQIMNENKGKYIKP